jgi:hypothetical protein
VGEAAALKAGVLSFQASLEGGAVPLRHSRSCKAARALCLHRTNPLCDWRLRVQHHRRSFSLRHAILISRHAILFIFLVVSANVAVVRGLPCLTPVMTLFLFQHRLASNIDGMISRVLENDDMEEGRPYHRLI